MSWWISSREHWEDIQKAMRAYLLVYSDDNGFCYMDDREFAEYVKLVERLREPIADWYNNQGAD